MVLNHNMSDLIQLGEKLVSEGPHKLESTPRRVRGLLRGNYIFDTLEARYVWEHPYYPYFYVPLHTFAKDAVLDKVVQKDHFYIGRLSTGSKTTERVIVFDSENGELSNLVRIEVSALDAWFVEDEKLLGPHPKDPYKRIETIPSSREIRIESNGQVLAKSTQNVFLFETMLRTRFYLDPTAVEWCCLRQSETVSFCPYKGMANYYHIDSGGKTIEDAVWYYKYPTAESALVTGRLCFYNEKFDVFIDGVKEDREGPKGR
ncbi:uncharacterized protein RAG0_01504 [Rhynchosporium agropyri]|uniref:DUF427 domain-containing protein n=1 Tax=Rhynchosporium agropyri TaxID=914238 RepID=A0A1E1JXN7_9HELO|nr:uncharacterized protein RAG0_01504 [Rhynchosporium agropyri]